MKHQKVIILGASSGIGLQLAKIYIQRGAQVGIAARRIEILEEVALSHSNVIAQTCDIQQPSICLDRLQRLVVKMGGNVDLFILCTGIGQMNLMLDSAVEQDTILTNVMGWTAVIDWFFNFFLQQGHGHLAAITSIASLRGLGPAPSYSATKAYQAHYLEALQQRAIASDLPICVTNIRPGFVKTPILAHPEKFFWVMPVEKVAKQIVCALDNNKQIVTVTRRWKIMVLVLLHLPNVIIAKIIKHSN